MGNVTAHFSCSDSLSGALVASPSLVLTGEGRDLTTKAVCRDKASNESSLDSPPIDIDRTPPDGAFLDRTPAANDAGWNNPAVLVRWTCTDALSGPQSDTVGARVSGEGADQVAETVCYDKAGHRRNVREPNIDVDLTKPIVTYDGNRGTYGIDGGDRHHLLSDGRALRRCEHDVRGCDGPGLRVRRRRQLAHGRCDRISRTTSAPAARRSVCS